MEKEGERRMEERELEDQIEAIFGECVGAHLALPPRFFPEGKSARDFVSVKREYSSFLIFDVDGEVRVSLSAADHQTLYLGFNELWDSLSRTAFSVKMAFLKKGLLPIEISLFQKGDFTNEKGYAPLLRIPVEVSPDSFQRLAEATRLGEIKRLAHSFLGTKEGRYGNREALEAGIKDFGLPSEKREQQVLTEALRMAGHVSPKGLLAEHSLV